MGVVVRRYRHILIIIITFPYSTCISSFWQQQPYFFVHFLNVFSFLFMLFLCNIANVAQRTFEIVQKLRSRKHGDIINYIDKNIECTVRCCARASPETSTCEVPCNVSIKLELTLCGIMAS